MSLKKDNVLANDVSILSNGVRIEGKLYSNGNVRIDGKVIGDVIVDGNLTIGEGAEIKGGVNAKNITLSGTMEGVLSSSEKLIMESKAVLKGDLFAKVLVVQEGAVFDGKSTMNKSEEII
ncbi:MAG: polymer-forming cytoskeletal protein [bacterium]